MLQKLFQDNNSSTFGKNDKLEQASCVSSSWGLFLLLQRWRAVQVKSSVRLMPQIHPPSRGLLPSPTAWSPDQHLAAMLVDVSRYILGRTEGRGLGFGQLVCTHTGKCLKCQSSSDGHSDHSALCAGRQKIVVCWARSSLTIGSRCAWYPPFSFFQSPLYREWRRVLASL